MTNTLKASSLLMALLSPFLSMGSAQADSLDEWAYWNANPQFSPEGFQFAYNSNPNPTTAEQTRTGTNQGNLAEATNASDTGWIGYSLASRSSLGINIYRSEEVAIPTKVLGDIALLPVNNPGTANDRLLYADNGLASLSLNLSGVGDENVNLAFHQEGSGSFSVYTPEKRSDMPTISIGEGGGTFNDRGERFISQKYLYTSQDLSQITGSIVIGKLMGLDNIARAVAAVPATPLVYSFYGISVEGSRVNIDVNFTQASWAGTFGYNSVHNGYRASGDISGNTLTSTYVGPPVVVGRSLMGGGQVVSGQVTGHLVGELGLSNQGTAGIIGKSELMVQPANIQLQPPAMGEHIGVETLSAPIVVEPIPVNDIFMLGKTPL